MFVLRLANTFPWEEQMFVTTVPEALDVAAGGLTGLGSTVTASNAAAAEPTMGVIPPAADETSALLAASFGTHGGMFQAAAAVGSVVHAMFASTMGISGASYAATEGFNSIASAI
jgi:hypothetical protein